MNDNLPDEKEYKKYKYKLTPFKLCVLQNFPFIEADFDAITNYQLLCKVVEYLNHVIDNQNTVEDNFKIMADNLNTLYNYFDTLDLQDEVNNKLDEMAENGQLADIVSLFINDDIKVAFPSYKTEGTDTLGDCSIIKSKNKSLMIDCFSDNDSCYIGIQETLYHLGITKLDYLLITHYHGDHFGNIYRLINDGYLDNATVILPRDCTRFPNNNGNAIKSALTEAGISYELCNNQTFYLDDVKVSLFNGNETDYAYYDSYNGTPEVQYNDYSIYANVEYKDKRLLFAGDGDYVSNAYVTPRYLLTGYDLLKDNHHGFIKFNPDYVKKVNPKTVLIPATIGMVNVNLSRWAIESGYWQIDTSRIYIQGYQKEELIFGLKLNSLECISDGYSVQGYSGTGSWNYYIDGTTTNLIRTGSRENPFKTLMEAVALVPKDVNYNIVFNCINLSSDTYNVNIRGFNNITINFNNILFSNGLNINYCNNIKLNDINITKHITIEDSRAIITNIESHVTDEEICIESFNSNITINGNITVDGYTGEAFRFGRNCLVDLNFPSIATSLLSATARIINSWGSTINFRPTTITALKNYKFLNEITNIGSARCTSYSNNVNELMTLYESETPEYASVVCSENLWDYDEIEVTVKTSDGFSEILKYTDAGNHSYMSGYCNASSTEVYIQCCRFAFTNNVINIARVGNIILKGTPAITIATGNVVGITKVQGIVK